MSAEYEKLTKSIWAEAEWLEPHIPLLDEVSKDIQSYTGITFNTPKIVITGPAIDNKPKYFKYLILLDARRK